MKVLMGWSGHDSRAAPFGFCMLYLTVRRWREALTSKYSYNEVSGSQNPGIPLKLQIPLKVGHISILWAPK